MISLRKIFVKKKNQKSQTSCVVQELIHEPINEPLDVPVYLNDKGGRPRTITDAHIIQIMRLKTENISNSEIARQLHVSEGTIRRYLKLFPNKNN